MKCTAETFEEMLEPISGSQQMDPEISSRISDRIYELILAIP